MLDLMLCCCHVEIPNAITQGAPTSKFALVFTSYVAGPDDKTVSSQAQFFVHDRFALDVC